MDKAIGEVMEDFDYAVIGEPNIVVASDLQEIEVFINTNIPNNDAVWKAYESPGDVITIIGTRASYKETPQVGGTRLNSWFNEAIHNRQQVGPEAYVSIDECHRPLYKTADCPADRDFGDYEEKVYLVFFMKIRETAQKDNHET